MTNHAGLALRSGIDFLLERQGDDGMWRDFITPAGEASCWPTGFVLSALNAVHADPASLLRAGQALLERQQSDGGWGYNEDTPSDADSTSWAVLALSDALDNDSRARAAAFLRRHRRRDGGIATYAKAAPIRRYTSLPRWLPFGGWCSSTVEVTATATRALRSIDCAAADDSGWRYVRSKQRPDGSWGAYWWTTPHVATQQAVSLGSTLGDKHAIQRASTWAIRVLDPHGPAFNIALCLWIVAAATPRDFETIERMVDLLHSHQLVDGSWASSPTLRIPVPADRTGSDYRGWRPIRFEGGLEVADQHRIFTTAACVAGLAQASASLAGGVMTAMGS